MPSKLILDAASPIVLMTKPNNTTVSFVIDVTCSGVYSLITFLIVTVFLAYLIRDKLWKKIAIIAVGLPIIYTLNILRITTLLAVGYNYGEETAQTLFHEASGLILTLAGALLIILIAQKLLKANFYKTHALKPCPHCSGSQTIVESFCRSCGRLLKPTHKKLQKNDLVKVVVVAAIIATLILIQPPIYALMKDPVGILGELQQPGQVPSAHLLPTIDNYTLRFEFRDTEWETNTGQDGTLTYSYTPNDSSQYKVWVLV